MTDNRQIVPGMVIEFQGSLYQVESAVKVSMAKGLPFIKTKLKDLTTQKIIEKNFKPDQAVKEVSLTRRHLEFMYLESGSYCFMDIDDYEQVLVPKSVVQTASNYLKEGVQVEAVAYADAILSIELPQFLEIMVAKVRSMDDSVPVANVKKIAVLETGAELEVPPFVEPGDIVKVDTVNNEYSQRV